ncbi:serine hydrolase domain-containing protein [Olivibacter sitiensis]|uniref:serine hydrolase domain-containing protein n=1 Tax=Olivibacter sitiensis TaxID=376470 RepID=UPI00040F3349|nr:serine hydrolase domain-containing protein [Olivibacter sitiensis]
MSKHHYFPQILFALFFIIAINACSSTAEKKQKKEREQAVTDSVRLIYDHKKADKSLDEFMQKLHAKSAFNGNVLIAKKGKIIYENHFGWADYLRKDSLKMSSQFELASVSKPLTATAILLLVQQGKLKLDQQVTDFFPDFPWPDITIRLLLSHRSGLVNYIYFTDDLWPDKSKGMSNKDAMSLLTEHKPSPYAKPDTRFHYNNSNFMILGSIIEKVSGQSFTVFMKEHIFDPLGMKHTAVYSKADYDKIPTNVVGHDKVWRRSVVQNFHDGPVGDKGIYSTVEDLFLFDQALKESRLLDKALQDSAYAPHNKSMKGVFNYGYGWRTFQQGDEHIVYHTGWWHGFRNLYVRDLHNDVTIVLLSNMANGSLLHLDELYKLLGMPVVRQGAYDSQGGYHGDD